MHEEAAEHGRDRVRPEGEAGDDPEVAAAAPERPEEVRVLVGAGADDAAVGGDELEAADVVAGEPVLAHEPADAAAERQPGDAGLRDDADRHREAVEMGLPVDVAKGGAALHPHGGGLGVDDHAAHVGEVDDEPVVAERPAGDVVAAAAHRDQQVVVAGEAHGADHVGDAAAADDQPGPAVDRGVPDRAGDVVARILGQDRAAGEPALRNLRRRRDRPTPRSA